MYSAMKVSRAKLGSKI
jgi:hypothetical protein